MPAKNAAAAASGSPAAPRNAKGGDKPAAPKDAQAKGGQKQAAQGAKGQEFKGQGSPQVQGQNAHPLSNDPELAAVQKKLNAIDATITKHRAEEEKFKKLLDEEEAHRTALKESLDALRAERKAYSESTGSDGAERQKQINKKQELAHARGIANEEAKKLREKLPTAPILIKAPAGAAGDVIKSKDGKDEKIEDHETYLKKIDDDIRLLEKSLSSSAVSLSEEKKKVEQISQLQKAKKTYKEYMAIKEKIAKDSATINSINASLDERSSARDEINKKHKEFSDKDEIIYNQIKESRANTDALFKQKSACREQINKDYEQLKNLKRELTDTKIALKEKRDEEWKKTLEARAAQKAKRDAEYQARQDKRAQEDLERTESEGPYESGLEYLCGILVQYLETLVPKEESDEVATSASAQTVEGATVLPKKEVISDEAPKRGAKGKKKKVVDLKHNIQIFSQFEQVSLVPPSKVADIDASIAELKAKQEHFKVEAAKKVEETKAALQARLNSTTTTTATTTMSSNSNSETPAQPEATPAEAPTSVSDE